MAKLIPLSRTDHVGLHLQPTNDLSELANQPTLPIYGAEVPKLALHYPLALIQQGEQYALNLLCSLSPELPSAWITPEGKWLGNYIPAILRQRPFTLLPNEEGEQVLCIDEESPLLGDEGKPLFEEGEPSELLKGILNFLNHLKSNGVVTQKIIDLLQQKELITPWEIKIRQGEEEVPVQGIYCIDEMKLNQLEEESWLELKNSGALPLIYAQLLSMANLQKLMQILKVKADAVNQQSMAEEDLDAFFGEGEDDLSFEGL